MTQTPHTGHPLTPARPRTNGREERLITPHPGLIVPGRDSDPAGRELDERIALLQSLGITAGPDPEFDDLASQLAAKTGFLYAMVNLFLAEQTFAGLHNPPPGSGHPIVLRTMSRAHGWCPEVVNRKKALPLPDVRASPRFASNEVVDAIGIHSYFGTPLIHESGVVLGTVCAIDTQPRSLADARRLLDIVKGTGDEVMGAIGARTP
ncbi:GAF domain-containing protein [Streptomyces collinus]|uniref:GAF domain-containing protein n=1 Tax=Streptomyces collinus TaxID=42684 RepID=UPI0037D0D29D